jgi:hypothetical protein
MLRISLPFLVLSLLVGASSPPTAVASTATSFRPVNPEELKMTSEPLAPGAPAIILYREVYRDDGSHARHEDNYFRIKILTEEGRKYGDVEIPFDKGMGNISILHARTIKPDGSIVDFDGKVFTKSIVKAKGVKYLAKTFTLPAVEAGCIIEYFYSLDMSDEYIYDSHWIVSNDLFTKAANFSLNPYANDYSPYRLHWLEQNMSATAPQVKEGTDHIIRLSVTNVPAFVTEDLMPPENEMKARVDFSYTEDTPESDFNRFWNKAGKRLNGQVEAFVGKSKGLEAAVAETVGPNDPPEVKLQKIYARVQQIRNTSYEVQKTEEEQKREKEKQPGTAEEVWKRGYGSGKELTWLYLAMVRAAGFEAYPVMVADREHYFFNPRSMESERLDANLVLIKLNGKTIFGDPGAAFTPFGLLPWQETGVPGLQLDKKESTWVEVLNPTPDQARIERHADLTITETGDLEGKLTVTYTGMEAASLRVEERNADETERKLFLENAVKGYIPAGCEVKLTSQPEWKKSALPLVAELSIRVPGWASGAGRHVIVPVGLFAAREKRVFDHVERVHPIYVAYPYAESDDINLQLPAGWQVSSLPQGWTDTGHVVAYTLKAENDKGKLHLTRELTVNFIAIETKYYPALRNYFQQIKATDEQQIVLEPGAARAGN